MEATIGRYALIIHMHPPNVEVWHGMLVNKVVGDCWYMEWGDKMVMATNLPMFDSAMPGSGN